MKTKTYKQKTEKLEYNIEIYKMKTKKEKSRYQ